MNLARYFAFLGRPSFLQSPTILMTSFETKLFALCKQVSRRNRNLSLLYFYWGKHHSKQHSGNFFLPKCLDMKCLNIQYSAIVITGLVCVVHMHMQLGAGCRGQNSQFPLVNDGRSSVGGAILASNWAITITSPGTARSATSGYDQAANFSSDILSIYSFISGAQFCTQFRATISF